MANKLHVKKGDTVQVISGKDKGAKGAVIEAFPSEGRIRVEGVNDSEHQQSSSCDISEKENRKDG